MVTDLTTCHNTWFNRGVDKCFVPTEFTARLARRMGLKESQIVIHGLPIRPAFSRRLPDKRRLRRHLGMSKSLPAVLIVGARPFPLPCTCPPPRSLSEQRSSQVRTISGAKEGIVALDARLFCEV